MDTNREDFLKTLASHRFIDTEDAGGEPRTHYEHLSLPRTAIEHASFRQCAAEMAASHLQYLKEGRGSNNVIIGQSGSGKSKLLEWYCERNPIVSRPDFDRIPVLIVQTPAKPSTKNLAEAFLGALDARTGGVQTETKLTGRILDLLDQHEVEFIAIDEVQHFLDHNPAAISGVTDWLKRLCDDSKRPITLAGLPRSLRLIRKNNQMRRRFSRLSIMKPFNARTPQVWREFRAVLRELHRRTPMEAVPFHEPDLARRFLGASEGLMDYLIRIVNGAIAISAAQRRPIDTELLALAFKYEIWPQCPSSLNPFLADGELRSLRGNDEPFQLWDDQR